MKVKFCLLLIFLVTTLSAQDWRRSESRNRWGDLEGYEYLQATNCTGRGSSGEGRWNFGIGYNTANPSVLLIGIVAIGSLEFAPVLVIFDEQVTISLREGNNIQTFPGLLVSQRSSLDALSIACMDTKIIDILRRNANFTILVEGKNNRWHVRANIKGNLPRE